MLMYFLILALTAILMSMGIFLQQVPIPPGTERAQLSGAEIQSLFISIIALMTAITAIGGLIGKFVQTYNNNKKLGQWASAVADDLDATKKSLQATDQWVQENQQKFTAGVAAVNSVLTPDQQKQLASQGVNIDNLTKELDDVTKELTAIYSTAPATQAIKPTARLH
jgi:hypothetical protein